MNVELKKLKILIDFYRNIIQFCPFPGYRFLITFFYLFVSFLLAEEISWGTKNNPFLFYEKQDLSIQKSSEYDENIKMQRKIFPMDLNSWFESIYISFDKKTPVSYRNTKFKSSFTILKKSYASEEYKGSVKEAGNFRKTGDQLWIVPPKYLFLKQTHHTGNFTILFLIKPHIQNRNMKIFRKISFFGGKKYGISCTLRNDKIVLELYNLLWMQDSPLEYLEIQSKDSISTSKFQKVMLQYRDDQARLSLYIDSVEQNSVYLTQNGIPQGNRYQIKFHPWDASPLIIGEGFSGALDEMIFSNQIFPPTNHLGNFGATWKAGDMFFQERGIFISQVFKLPYSQSSILNLQYQVLEPEGSNIFLYFRSSDRIFSTDTNETELPFKGIQPSLISPQSEEQRSPKTLSTFQSKGLGKAKYIQWKAVFRPGPLGKVTPILEEVRLNYRPNPPPQAPQNLEVVSSEEGKVTLRFSRNSELDVLEGGRYHIYYGVRPDKALGVLRYKKINAQEKIPITDKDSLKTNDIRYQNKIQITLDNSMLYQNMVYARNNPFLHFKYPLLQKGIAYYFWVTACDNAFRESVEYSDHESEPSNRVVIRIK